MKKPKDARVKDENDFEWLKQLEPQRAFKLLPFAEFGRVIGLKEFTNDVA